MEDIMMALMALSFQLNRINPSGGECNLEKRKSSEVLIVSN